MPTRACLALVFAAALAGCDGAVDGAGDGGGRDAQAAADSGGPPDGGGGTTDSGQPPGQDAGADAGGSDAGATMDAGRYTPYVYVGSSNGNIYRFAFNEADGGLSQPQALAVGGNPSFLAFSPDARALYAVNESGAGTVRAFAIDGATGALSARNSVSSEGNGPAHVAVDKTGRWVMVANYGAGTTAVLPVNPDGGLGAAVDRKSPGLNAHLILPDLTNRHVFVPCLGSNLVAQFRFDEATGGLTANTPASVATSAGAGPRHLAFHPNGQLAYLINELDSTMTALALDAQGRLTPLQTQSTLPNGMTQSTCAEVQVHPSGVAVYGSNRVTAGPNGNQGDIVTFTVGADGRLTLLGHTSTLGATPRHFSLDPSGRWLLAANQGSGTIAAMRVDPATGALGAPAIVAGGLGGPAFVGVLRIPQP